jgi:putative transposase
MELSETGEIVEKMWFEIPNHHEYVELGEFVVMPNHVHGIILLNKPDDVDDDVIEIGHALSL